MLYVRELKSMLITVKLNWSEFVSLINTTTSDQYGNEHSRERLVNRNSQCRSEPITIKHRAIHGKA